VKPELEPMLTRLEAALGAPLADWQRQLAEDAIEAYETGEPFAFVAPWRRPGGRERAHRILHELAGLIEADGGEPWSASQGAFIVFPPVESP
jgi:hypothetical protein